MNWRHWSALGAGIICLTVGCGGGGGGPADTTAPVIGALNVTRTGDQVRVVAAVTDSGTGVESVTAVVIGVGLAETSIAMAATGTANQFATPIASNAARVRVEARSGAEKPIS